MNFIKRHITLLISLIFFGSCALLAYFTSPIKPGYSDSELTISNMYDSDGHDYDYYWAKPAHKEPAPVKKNYPKA